MLALEWATIGMRRIKALQKRKQTLKLNVITCLLLASVSLNLYWWQQNALRPSALAENVTASVAFSPRQGATDLVVQTIQNAQQYIYVAAYYFTSKPIADALAQARARGVEVKIVLDRSQINARGSLLEYFKEQNLPYRINNQYKIMHNKFIIIDGVTLQTGSFNYTRQAQETNAENVLVISNDFELVNTYLTEWHRLWQESAPHENSDI